MNTLNNLELETTIWLLQQGASDRSATSPVGLRMAAAAKKLTELKGIPQSIGAERIAAERLRQMQREGYTAAHDDSHNQEELAYAAQAYLLANRAIDAEEEEGPAYRACLNESARDKWPWEPETFKPSYTDKAVNLVKACALFAAEIDRLDRASQVKI